MKWISVKDALPKKYERILVTDGKFVCLHYKLSHFDDLMVPINSFKGNNCCYLNEDNITHWAYIDEIKMDLKKDDATVPLVTNDWY